MKYFLFLFVLAIVGLLSISVTAQPSFLDRPTEAPIDGGLIFLASAGGAYAIRRLRKKWDEPE